MTWTSRHSFRPLYAGNFEPPTNFGVLPDDYLAFMSKFNGIIFEADLLIDFSSGMSTMPTEPFDDCFNFSVLYGSYVEFQDDLYDIKRCQNDYGFSTWNAGKLVSIGGGKCFNELCLSIRPSDFGFVYRWLWPSLPPSEKDLEGEEWRNSTLYRLASSFSEFWQKLDSYAMSDPLL